MQEILNIFFWLGTIAGGLLVVLLLLSILGGMDLDSDVDGGIDLDAGGDADSHADIDATDAPLGLIKTILTFISVGAFTARAILLNTGWSWALVIVTALISGGVAVLLLSWFFKWLLKNQEEGNWHLWQTEGKVGTVYVPIPKDGKGRVTVEVDNVNREIAAESEDGAAIGSRRKVMVVEAREDHVVVSPIDEN